MKRLFLLMLCIVSVLQAQEEQPPPPNPHAPAERMEWDGVPDVFTVSRYLHFGGVPGEAGWDTLRKAGVRTVVDLRPEGLSEEQQAGLPDGLVYEFLPVARKDPTAEELIQALNAVADPARQPVFFLTPEPHTAAMLLAFYRLYIDGWSQTAITAEIESHGQTSEAEYLALFNALDLDKIRVEVKAPTKADRARARFIANFKVLLSGSWKDLLVFVGLFIWAIVFWTIIFAVIGLIVGIIVYLLVRRRKWMRLDYSWYRYIGWLWAPTFVLSIFIGAAYAGPWFGGGRFLKQAIREDRVIDKVVISIYLAAALDTIDYELKGDESYQELDEILAAAEGSRVEVDQQYKDELTALAMADIESDMGKKVYARTVPFLNFALDNLAEEEMPYVRVLLVHALHPEKREAFLKANPDSKVAMLAVGDFFARMREEACSLINGVVYPNVLGSIGLGLVIPFALVLLMHLINWLCRWIQAKRTGTPADESAAA